MHADAAFADMPQSPGRLRRNVALVLEVLQYYGPSAPVLAPGGDDAIQSSEPILLFQPERELFSFQATQFKGKLSRGHPCSVI